MEKKLPALQVAFVAWLALGIAGCQPDQATEPTVKAPDTLLAGPLPSCKDYIAPGMQPYRVAALRDCDGARTVDERINSVGCMVNQKRMVCPGMTLEMIQADKLAAGIE